MIDYIKINDLIAGLKVQDLLEFELKVNQRTGELLTNRKKSAYLRNLVFTITPGERFVKVQGSLHKYSNGGGNNYDRFTFDRFLQVADDLKQYISADDRINVLEFGVNLRTDFDPSEFIDNLVAHLKKPFNKTIYQGMQYAQCEYRHFILKVYNKSLQQSSEENILRIEVKYLRMQKIFPDGLKWSALSDISTWSYLGEILRKKFSEVIYYDPSVHLKDLPEREMQFIKEGRNPFYWQDLTGAHVSRIRKHYQNLINRYGSGFRNLPELLDQEVHELVKSYHYLNTANVMSESTKNKELVKSYTLLYSNISPSVTTMTDPAVCKVTGIDISMQRPGSKFLCTAGIKYLYYHDKDLYERLSDERLSPKWLRYSLDVQFREIAHSIRNEFYNPHHNSKRAILKILTDPVLFDDLSLIRQDKRILAGI